MTIEIKTKSPLYPVANLKPYHKNRNIHSKDQIDRIAYLIQKNGMRDPLSVCEDTMQVITGNGTLEACIFLGMTEVPCDMQNFKNEAERYAYSVSHNSVAKQSLLDMAGINLDLPDFGPDEFDDDFKLLGFENFTMDPPILDDFEEPKPKDGPSTKETELIKCPNCGVVYS